VRHSSVVTIAPTGTISRLADCSSGIEPHFANAWWSNVLWKGEGASKRLLDAPKSVWEALRAQLGDEDKVRAVLEQLADSPDDAENIFAENDIDPAHFRTSMNISAEAHIRMQAAWQKYVTNSVSKTINLPNSATIEDVDEAYRLAWETGCKAVTVYRDGSKSMQVLETGSKEEAPEQQAAEQQAAATPVPLSISRPRVNAGITESVLTAHGNLYVTVNYLTAEDGSLVVNKDGDAVPFEVFTAIGKAGGDTPAHLEGLSRVTSLSLRRGVDIAEIISELKGITSEPVLDGDVLIRSAEDGVAHVLRSHARGPFKPLAQTTVALNGLVALNGTADASGANANGIGSGGCPKCDGRVVHQEGCIRCLECGYTKCD
jgi:ribonucleoside-diphosphate reductase alpha chain